MKKRLGIDYEHLFQVIPDNYLVIANDPPAHTIVDASDAYLQGKHQRREEIIEKSLWDTYRDTADGKNARALQALRDSFRSCVENGRPYYQGVVELYPQGNHSTKQYWESTTYPVVNPRTGAVTGFVLATHEVTGDVSQDRRIELMRDQQDSDLAIGVMGLWRMIPGGDEIVVDEAMKQMFGFTHRKASELLDVNQFIERIHPEDRERVMQGFAAKIDSRETYAVEYRIMPSDDPDSVIWIGSRSRLVTDESGDDRYAGIVMDITERKQAEEELAESEQELRFMADSMLQLVWMSDPNGVTTYFNKQWTEFTGIAEGTLHDDGLTVAVHPDDKPSVREAWRSALKTGEMFEMEYRVRNRSGEYEWFIARATPYVGRSGKVLRWYGTATNINDRKLEADRLENLVEKRTVELREANQTLARSNEELQNFAYVASHDLQEPLRKIQAFGNLLRDEYHDKLGDGADYLDRMQASAQRMGTLIEDLLSFSRVTTQAKPAAAVDLNEIIHQVHADLEARLQRTGGQLDVKGKLPTVHADPTHMWQLFQNVVGNALKFHKPDEPPVVTIRSKTKPNVYEITVADNGIGFDQKYAEQIFSVFQRLHGRSEYEGTGIGLAICRKIVERYGGTITVTSQPGNGTTFTISFPRSNKRKR